MNKLFRNLHTKSLNMIIQYDGNNFFKITDFFEEINKLYKKNYDTKLIIDLYIDDLGEENILSIYGTNTAKSEHLELNVKVGDYLVYSFEYNIITVLSKELVEVNFEEITEKEIYEEVGYKSNIGEVYWNTHTHGFNRAIQFTGNNADEIVSFVKSCLNDDTSIIKTFSHPSSVNDDLELQIENKDHYFQNDPYTIRFKSYIVCEEYSGIKDFFGYSEKEFKRIYVRFDHDEKVKQKSENHVLTVRSLKNNKIYQAIEFDGENVDEIIEFIAHIPEYYGNISYTLDDGILVLKIENNGNTKDFAGTIYIQLFSYIVFMSDSKHFIVYDRNRFFELFTTDIEEKQQEKKNNIYVDNSVNEVHHPITSTVANVINILGTEYKLFRCKEGENGVDSIILGLCDRNLKQIRIVDISTIDRYKDTTSEWKYINELNTLKHEIVHAYLTESGLNSNTHFTTCWAEDEEIVDWIAWQTEKIVKSFNEVNEWLKQFFTNKEDI